MKHTIELDDTEKYLAEINKIALLLDDINSSANNLVDTIKFLKVSDVARIMGITTVTAREIFNRPDFPKCNYGKEQMVEINAFLNYFQKPVLKGE